MVYGRVIMSFVCALGGGTAGSGPVGSCGSLEEADMLPPPSRDHAGSIVAGLYALGSRP
jgi:hypothetical protein